MAITNGPVRRSMTLLGWLFHRQRDFSYKIIAIKYVLRSIIKSEVFFLITTASILYFTMISRLHLSLHNIFIFSIDSHSHSDSHSGSYSSSFNLDHLSSSFSIILSFTS
jgi:hypothetical protein